MPTLEPATPPLQTLHFPDGEAQFRMIFEQSPIAISIVGRDMHLLKVNPAFCALLGYSEQELSRLSFIDLIRHEDRNGNMPLYSRLLREETSSFKTEKRYLRKDGTTIWARLTVSLLQNPPDAPQCCIVFSENILNEKLAEEKRKAHARVQRNALIREVNHRIKNNIQSVIGLLRYQIRHNPELNKPMQQAIDRLHTIAVVHGMQGISRLGNSSLVKMVSQICDAAQSTSHCRLKLQIQIPNDVVVVDEESVPTALIINELVTNAVKHGNAEQSPIRVTLAGDKEISIIRIENAASGLDAFNMESRHSPGTGLNLVKALLPPSGASLAFKPGHGEVTAELRLTPPVTG